MFHLKREGLIDELDGVLAIGDFYNRAEKRAVNYCLFKLTQPNY